MPLKPRVLFVDDEPGILEIYRNYFGLQGFETLLAANGFEATEIIRTDEVDAVVTDLRMPGVDGELALEVIYAMRPDLPVIVRSAYAGGMNCRPGEYGLTEVIDKTASLETLRAALGRALSAQRE